MHPRKRFGQNFLADGNTIDRIVAAIGPRPEDHIIEIGPGRGALTEHLIESGCRLSVIEIDRDLAADLKARHPTLDVIVTDVLKHDFNRLRDHAPARIVGNLPYNISTPLLFKLFAHLDHILDMYFMLQLEVVDRMAAQPSTHNYGRLSVMNQYYCDVMRLFTVPASAFIPKPKVVSAFVRLLPRKPGNEANDVGTLEKILTHAFSRRRKTIRNALKGFISEEELASLSLDPSLRPENLSVSDYISCANLVSARD